jgi:hydroxymethylbilane synthase
VDAVVVGFEDLRAELPSGLEISVVCERLTPYLALVSQNGTLLDDMLPGARVGVVDDLSRFELSSHRSDLDAVTLRQSWDTNLKRVRAGKLDGLLAPVLDLELLGWQNAVSEVLDASLFLPPAGRGVFALVSREGSKSCEKWLSSLEDSDTRYAMDAEMALLGEMNGLDGCLGALANVSGRVLTLEAAVWGPEGMEITRDSAAVGVESAAALGRMLAERLFDDGAERLLRRGRRWNRGVEKVPSSSGAKS